MNIQQAQMNAARSDMAKAQHAMLLAQMTASIAGPLVAVEYAAALRKAQDQEESIPGQTDGMMELELARPLQLAHNMAVTILRGPQKAVNGQPQPAE